jgi:RNAse (barnase) inhibitor barstar
MTPFHFPAESAVPTRGHVVVVPAHLESKAALLAFLAQAIPLPDYFGQNWDALEECLADLNGLTLVHQDIPLDSMPEDQRTYLLILADAALEPKRLVVSFPQACRHPIERLLRL